MNVNTDKLMRLGLSACECRRAINEDWTMGQLVEVLRQKKQDAWLKSHTKRLLNLLDNAHLAMRASREARDEWINRYEDFIEEYITVGDKAVNREQ